MKYIVFTFLFFSLNVYSQDLQNIRDFYYKIYKADLQFKNGYPDSALISYENAFKQVEFVSSVLLRKAEKLSRVNKDKTRIKYYKKQILIQKKCPEENKGILAKVDSLLRLDQKYMGSKYGKASVYCESCLGDSLCDTTSKKYVKSVQLKNIRTKIFFSNINYLIKLMEEHGYIGEQMIGSKNQYGFHVQLFHYDNDTNNRILKPILLEALIQNRISPLTFAVTMDRHLYSTSGKQKYWTSPFETNNPNLSEKEIMEVLKLRESIGIYGSKFKFIQLGNGEWRVINTYMSL